MMVKILQNSLSFYKRPRCRGPRLGCSERGEGHHVEYPIIEPKRQAMCGGRMRICTW